MTAGMPTAVCVLRGEHTRCCRQRSFLIYFPDMNIVHAKKFIMLFAVLAAVFQCAPSSAAKRVFRVFIDPGHTRHTNSVGGILGPEYLVNFAVSRHLEDMLRADRRFAVVMSRGASNYHDIIPAFTASNRDMLYGMARMVITNDKRNAQLDDKDLAELYAVRQYAIKEGFDLLVSVHFDYVVDKRRQRDDVIKGFHVCVSPNNRRFNESMAAARTIRGALASRYRANTALTHNRQFITPDMRKKYDLDGLLRDGINIRSLIILGDAFEAAYFDKNKITPMGDIPSVLVECGFLHEKQFLEEAERKELAACIYRGIVSYAGYAPGVPQ